MKIEHIAIYVQDIEKMRVFYETYLNATSHAPYMNPKTQLKTYFLTFEEGARLELMCRPDMALLDKPLYRTGFTHLAFSLGSKEAVDALTQRIKEHGYPIVSGPRITGDGYYETCFLDPEGNQIEITI